jgi:hypothetical protein
MIIALARPSLRRLSAAFDLLPNVPRPLQQAGISPSQGISNNRTKSRLLAAETGNICGLVFDHIGLLV